MIIHYTGGPGGPVAPTLPSRPGGPVAPTLPSRPGGPVAPLCPGCPSLPSLPGSPGMQEVAVAGHDPAASVLRSKAGNQLRARSSPTASTAISTAVLVTGVGTQGCSGGDKRAFYTYLCHTLIGLSLHSDWQEVTYISHQKQQFCSSMLTYSYLTCSLQTHIQWDPTLWVPLKNGPLDNVDTFKCLNN